jgi:hypothetical protein
METEGNSAFTSRDDSLLNGLNFTGKALLRGDRWERRELTYLLKPSRRDLDTLEGRPDRPRRPWISA